MSFPLYVNGLILRQREQELKTLFSRYGLSATVKNGGLLLLSNEPSAEILNKIKRELGVYGFRMITDNRAGIIHKVKTLLEQASSDMQQKVKLSEFLAFNMPYEYHYLSSVFSQVEGVTVEQFYINLKIDRIKELLEEDKLTITEISYKCGYSSPAHLTNQFKRITGATPTNYKQTRKKE